MKFEGWIGCYQMKKRNSVFLATETHKGKKLMMAVPLIEVKNSGEGWRE